MNNPGSNRPAEKGQAHVRVRAMTAFGVLLVGFAAQIVFRVAVGEPYPGLFGPLFGPANDVRGTVEAFVPRFEVTKEDGTVRQIALERVLYDFGGTEPNATLMFFGRSIAERPDVRTWVCARLRHLGHGDADRFAAVLVSKRGRIPSGRLVGTKTVRRVDFERPCGR